MEMSLHLMTFCIPHLQAHLTIWDGDNITGDVYIGQVELDLEQVIENKGQVMEYDLELYNKKAEPIKEASRVQLSV